MNRKGPFAKTVQPNSKTGPGRPEDASSAELFRFEERHCIRSRQTTPSSKKFVPPIARGLLIIVAMGLVLAGCSPSAKVLSVKDVSKGPVSQPAMVYVSDFELAPDSIQSESRLSSHRLHAYLEQSKARSLVVTMSNSIIEDLAKKGIASERLTANSPLPRKGWLVRGVFMKVDEGDRAKRAVIGFGSGQTDLKVLTTTDDLSAEPAPTPLYRMQLDSTSNKAPGAVITLNPYVAAAKFVLAGKDLDRSTQATAEQIADKVAARVNGTQQTDHHNEPVRPSASPSFLKTASQ
jgi:Domain of unknown function (DUF4410)